MKPKIRRARPGDRNVGAASTGDSHMTQRQHLTTTFDRQDHRHGFTGQYTTLGSKSLSNITASHHPKSTAVQCGPLLIANRALSKSSASSLAGRDLPLSRTPDTPVINKQSRASGYKGTSAQSMRAWGGHTRDTYTFRESGSASRDAGKKKSCLAFGTKSPSQSGWPYRAG